jgi:transcriptional regulator with XRE-family HTH domain
MYKYNNVNYRSQAMIGQRIKLARKKAGFSLRGLADALGRMFPKSLGAI